MDAPSHTTIVQMDEQLRTMIRKFVAERDKVVVQDTVTLPQLHVLMKLKQQGPMKAGQLSDELQFSPGAMTAICDRLVKEKYVTRERPQKDRRIMLLNLTDKGTQLLKATASVQSEHLRWLFRGFSEEEMSMLHSFSERLFHNLDGYSEVLLRAADLQGEHAANQEFFKV
ncbi:MarR family transcriptional regulator [Paenibacillus sp. RC67]|uniref:MarR family winged helix-turn-helix transcriptional regulator n=1 Tax=Paenibacillus sp. RC67 TaxID=3039392 RepID=UPI0024AE00B6|nr:MarR family transcriptional regulator [Paenibacillus sp. RC67]